VHRVHRLPPLMQRAQLPSFKQMGSVDRYPGRAVGWIGVAECDVRDRRETDRY
jgi:hypothetical protein